MTRRADVEGTQTGCTWAPHRWTRPIEPRTQRLASPPRSAAHRRTRRNAGGIATTGGDARARRWPTARRWSECEAAACGHGSARTAQPEALGSACRARNPFASIAANDAPVIDERAATRGRVAMEGGNEHAGAKSALSFEHEHRETDRTAEPLPTSEHPRRTARSGTRTLVSTLISQRRRQLRAAHRRPRHHARAHCNGRRRWARGCEKHVTRFDQRPESGFSFTKCSQSFLNPLGTAIAIPYGKRLKPRKFKTVP
jgi:hypothetical protein